MNNNKNSGCFRPFYCPVCSFSKVSKLEKKFSRSLSPEISMLRRSLKVNLFFKSRTLRAGSLFFSKFWGLVLYRTILRVLNEDLDTDGGKKLLTPSPPHLVHVVIEWPLTWVYGKSWNLIWILINHELPGC